MRKPSKKQEDRHSLGPHVWRILNDRTPNPFVFGGFLTRAGIEHLERLERKKKGTMTRDDFLYFMRRLK